MVRETRYLLVGNLPETTTENDITEYFKRFGKIQKVKVERRPDDNKDTDSDEKEEGIISGLTATVAFTDIKSASNAHKAEKKIGNNTLTSEYSEGFGATGSVVKRTHEPDIFPRPPPGGAFPSGRKGFEEEADGFDVYYGTSPQFNEPPGYPSPGFADRGRPRERWAPGANFPGRGAKWSAGAQRVYTDSSSKDGFEKPKAASSIPASSPTHSATQSSGKQHKKKKSSKSVDRSRSSSGSSRASSSDSVASGSASSSKERPKLMVTSTVQRSDNQESAAAGGGGNNAEIEPGEREPLGLYIKKLPLRSSDTSLRDGLFHEYKKYGKVTAVQVSGVSETRYAIISFKQAEDAAKALEGSRDKRFFGTCIQVAPHEGIEVEDSEFSTPEAQLDEHSPKATRTLFLGNLEKEITIEEIKEKLDKYGDILDVDVKRQGAVSAYAFVQFCDISSVVRALKDLDGSSWGNKLKVGFGKSMATSVIWLDSLADSVNEGFLCRQFGRFGAISHTVVDKIKGRGLIFFLNIESAQYALPEMRNRIWNGKKIHIDFASRDCQESFFVAMEKSGQLRPGERPETTAAPEAETVPVVPGAGRGNFQPFNRGRGRGFQRGRGAPFRGRGGSFDGAYSAPVGAAGSKDFPVRRKQFDEFSQGSEQYMEGDSYEQELRKYGHSQRERRDRSSQSPPGYDNLPYYEGRSQTGTREFDAYEKHRYDSYRSLSPGSDRDMDINDDDYKYKTRTPSDERYYYKTDKYYDEAKSRDRSHSTDSEQRYRLQSEISRRNSRSRSPTMKHKRTKDLPISYRSPSPPTPTDDEPPSYFGDHSPTDFDSAYRKYDYKKRLGSNSLESEKKSGLLTTGLRKEIESKSEERSSRKRSYDQVSPKRSDSLHRMERQHSRGSRSGSMYDNEKLSAKELLSKVARMKSEVHEHAMGKDSPSSGSSYSDIDTSTMTEAELGKLHREKQKLLEKLTLLEDPSDGESNGDTRRVVSKKARIDLSQSGLVKYLQKSGSLENMTKYELKEKLKMMDLTQSCRKQMETLRKKEVLRELKKSKSLSDKKDMLDYSEDEDQLLHSPRDLPSGFMPKKRRKVEGESDRKSRSYRGHHEDDDVGFSSDDERRDILQRQSSSHSDPFTRSRTSGLDVRLENESLFSSHNNESRRISSGSDSKDNNDHGSSSRGHRRHKHKKDDHITPLIPLGDDNMPDPETSDPRVFREKSESPKTLPLPEFAQFIQFSPLPSPHHSPERYSDLPSSRGRDSVGPLPPGADGSNQAYQSPCFSPQSSSSKTHSPSQSPSGSGSESKTNTNSDSGEIPPGFPTEQVDPLNENKPDGLNSKPDPTKLPTESKEDDSFSDNNSDMDLNLSTDNISIEERIRQLDEKWNKAQAVVAASSKVIPDVQNVVNSSSAAAALPPLSAAPVVTSTSATSPSVPSLYSKFRIRKKNDATNTGNEKAEPSELVQTMLSKSSIFDQDSKRLGQVNFDKADTETVNDNSSKVTNTWENKVDESVTNPMVTVPGSLMDRLGQSHNMSFPTLNVTTSYTNSVLYNNGNSNNAVNKSDLSSLSKVSSQSDSDLHSETVEKFTVEMEPLKTPPKSILVKRENSPNETSNLHSTSVDSAKSSWQADNVEDNNTQVTIANVAIVAEADNNKLNSVNLTNNKSDSFKPDADESSVSLNTNSSQDMDISENNVTNIGDKVSIPTTNTLSELDNNSVNTCTLNTSGAMDIKDSNVSSDTNISKTSAIVNNDVKKETSTNVLTVKDPASRSAFDAQIFELTQQEVTGKKKVKDGKSELNIETKQEITKTETKTELKDVKVEQNETKTGLDNVKVVKTEVKEETTSQVKTEKTEKDKHSHRDSSSSKSERRDSSKEPSSKKQKTSKDKDKKSVSSHKDDKHKRKEGEKKGESSHKSSTEKKDDKKHKTKSDKDKKETDKKPKEESEKKVKEEGDKKSKDSKDKKEKEEKKKKSEKKEKDKKDEKEKKEDKKEVKKDKSTESKDKDKTEKKEKEKHDKKESHKHDKHKNKSPEKRSKSGSREGDSKESTSKSETVKDEVPKDTVTKDTDKDKPEKTEKSSSSEQSSKKEHKKSSSHKAKKSKDPKETSSKKSKDEESKKSKDEESKKVKDDHSEHKKKDETNDKNNKDSPDKNKDANRKASVSESKKSSSSSSAEHCKEQKVKEKEKENKDKDHDKHKGKSTAEMGDKNRHQSGDKNKSESDHKEDKKGKEDVTKTSNTSSKSNSKDKDKSDSQKKSSSKSEKTNKAKSSDSKTDSKSKEKSDTKDSDSKKERKESKDKETPEQSSPVVENGLTEEDLAIFAQFSEPSMYDKVKKRACAKKIQCQNEQKIQKKLISEYKRSNHKLKNINLSDITDSSDAMSSDDHKEKQMTKSRKKFVFSSNDDSDSSSGTDMLKQKNKTKTQSKQPHRLLDIYSSDSEEEEIGSGTPSKKPSSGKMKKNNFLKDAENHFNFDSLSDSDHKTSSTKPAKAKTVKPENNKKQTKSKPSPTKTPAKINNKEVKKPAPKPKTQRNNFNFKDLFSDDSDDSMLSDSDSDSDIMMSSKNKKKLDTSMEMDHRKLPKGSSIYTTSEDSSSEYETKNTIMTPPRKTSPLKRLDRDHGSESFTSDIDIPEKETAKKKELKKNKINDIHNSLDNDHLISDYKLNKHKLEMKSNNIYEKPHEALLSQTDLFGDKIKKQKSKDKSYKNGQKLKNKKLLDMFSDGEQYGIGNTISRHEIVADVYSESFYEKDKLLANLSNKDNLPPILSEESLFKLDVDTVRNDIPSLKDMNGDDKFGNKLGKTKNKKHKKENKKKKKNKEKGDKEKDTSKDKHDVPKNSFPEIQSDNENYRNNKIEEKSENIKPDSDFEMNSSGNSVNRNLFEELKTTMKSPKQGEGKKKKKEKKEKENQLREEHHLEKRENRFEPERLSDSDFLSDNDRKKEIKEKDKLVESPANVQSKPSKSSLNSADVFDFKEDEDDSFRPIKESHVKIMKPDSYDIKNLHDEDKEVDSVSSVPIEIQGVEIEYQTEEQDYKDEDEGLVECPVVEEASEVVIEQSSEEKPDKAKPKPRKRKGRKNSGKDGLSSEEPADLVVDAVTSLEKEHKNTEEIQTEDVLVESPVSNEQELVIDEGVSLHVEEDETEKAVGSIVNVNDQVDETAAAVESILFDSIPSYPITEPVEPTPELDQNYLQPDFAPGLPSSVPQVGTEVETTTASTPIKGKKGRKGRRSKSGQGDSLLSDNSSKDLALTPSDTSKLSEASTNKSFDFFENTNNSFTSNDLSNLHDPNDDDDDDRLQIDFDPPKPEPKQKKPRKPKQTKVNKMADAVALAAENKMGNLFGFDQDQNKEGVDLNRDSVSSENSELERSKHEELLFMDREDQRHDSDMMSPDERSTSDDLTSPTDTTKVKARRGRKPKNKDPSNVPIPRTNSPRATRTLSPRSPRTDPRSPKYDYFDPKLNGTKALVIEEIPDPKTVANKSFTNVFDFDENDETAQAAAQIQQAATVAPVTKQRKPRRKKGEMMSPENRGMFSSPEHKFDDKLVIASPDAKMMFNSPEHKPQFNMTDQKIGMFSPQHHTEELKIEIKTALDDKPPEPLFKAFFESKGSKDCDKVNPLLAAKKGIDPKLLSPTFLMMSNVDKTIDDVSKGLFESTDDESNGYPGDPTNTERKRNKSCSSDLLELKSPSSKSPIKSPLHQLNSPPALYNPANIMSYPGTTQPGPHLPIGEPLLAGHSAMMGQMSPPVSMTVGRSAPQGLIPHTAAPELLISPSKPGLESQLKGLGSPIKVTSLATTGITTTASTSPSVVVSSAANLKEQRKPDQPELAESPFKNLMPGYQLPALSVSTGLSVASGILSTTSPAQTKVSPSSASSLDLQRQQQPEMLSPSAAQIRQQQELNQKQLAEEQKIQDQKQLDLQKQQEHHVMLKEKELKQKEIEQKQQQQQMAEQQAQATAAKKQHEQQQQQQKQHKQMQEQMQHQNQQQQLQLQEMHSKQMQEQIMMAKGLPNMPSLNQSGSKPSQEMDVEKMKEEHKKLQLLEHQKQLQQQYEQLQRQQVMQAAAAAAAHGGAGNPSAQPLLSPGALQGPRPSLPSPGEGHRPAISAHHQMPPGAPFGLGPHPAGMPIGPGQLQPHLTPAQIAAMQQHLVQPLGPDKTASSADIVLKHQQLQQHIAAQAHAQHAQKAQVQALAEQQAQMAKQQAQQAQAHAKQQTVQQGPNPPGPMGMKPGPGLPGKPNPAPVTPGKKGAELQGKGPGASNKKDMLLQRPQPSHGPPPLGHDTPNPPPGSQEAANQLQMQIKQQLAMSQHGQSPAHGPPAIHGAGSAPHPMMPWPGMRPEGPRQSVPMSLPSETRTSMPGQIPVGGGPITVMGGIPQSVQRVSPHPPTKSPTVAQTAPNMGLGFSQHQTAAPRAPSPAVAKTAERPAGGKWTASPGAQRPGQPEVRPRAPSTETTPPSTSRPESWAGMNGPSRTPPGMNITPRPAHQQPPSAHQHQPDHAPLQLKRAPAPPQPDNKDKQQFLQQQQKMQAEMARQQEMMRHQQQQEIQRQQQIQQQLHAQAQKEAQIHKERERAESLEREKREREARTNLTSQSPSDPRQSPAIQRLGYPFVEPRPPSRDGKLPPQSPAIVDPRDPRFSQQYSGHHPTDLRMGAAQTSAFSPAAGSSGDAAHMYTPAELQRLQQNGLIPAYPPGLRMLEPHLMPGHAPPYMIPGHHLAYMAQQMEHQHLVDGRPPSIGSNRPPSNQPTRPVSPQQTQQNDGRGGQQQQQGPVRPGPPQGPPQQGQTMGPPGSNRDPHPGDGSLLSLLQRYPVMWQGVLGLKNDQCVVQMHFISGFQPLVKMSLPQQAPDGTVQPLRIAQRMRLEQTQLEGVAKRMQLENDYCMMLALPCGRDHTDIYQQTRAMSTGFIQYLQQKQAAGIVNVADPGSQQPAYVVHIFPPCEFSQTTLSRLGFDLLYQVKDLAHLIVIIATVA